ncbi:hypothetical protein [Candidatus Sulfurimonas baltica]|uniref:Uncharacterized protein n=1 Tax=Candidatus Sulfurimonas baltica TaxID=2740404 RepID=A0A7S7LUS0_9BACT|nr:hypothetical protein [Candidatus Sulfurimonas baltica]QOY51710.1 hypothetical protein HUE88_11480 [Candidatus Sulfurimonas baltica]
MSRWIVNFDNDVFKTTWEDLKAKLDISEVDETTATSVEELARLKKVIVFIDNAFEGIDPELIPASFITNFNTQTTECRNQIISYNSNKNIGHITNANNNADNLLSYIRPYLLSPDALKKSLLGAIRAYASEIDKHLGKITDTEAEYKKVKNFREEIEEYYDVLFASDDENESIKLQIATLLEDSEEKYNALNKFHAETLVDGVNESTQTTITEAKKDILRDVKETNEKLVDVSAKIEKLNKFYTKIFGSEDENGKITGGLEKELEQKIKDLESFKSKQEKTYNEEMTSRLESLKKYEQDQQTNNKNLYEQIESLLPGATSAGLAKAYQDMKESFDKPIKYWNITFISIVSIMFISTFISFVDIGIVKDNTTTWFAFKQMGDFTSTLNSLLFKLPLYAPLIWLAIFASKRRSENQRLQQEYAHKEALAKSYVSYKMQIDELKQEDKKLLEKLLDSSIDTVAHNASVSLDQKHGDSTPVQETIKMFVEQVTKLKG